ncbi:MAG: alpha-glucosidase/alpha-galactosidase, partial [Clostridia bacterium]
CVVESNALFERDAVRPIYVGELSPAVRELLEPHVRNQQDLLTAALTHDFSLALAALQRDPLVKGRISEPQARELLTTLLQGSVEYLPKAWNLPR